MRLEVENVSKSFPGVIALDGASLEIRPGESTRWWARTAQASRR